MGGDGGAISNGACVRTRNLVKVLKYDSGKQMLKTTMQLKFTSKSWKNILHAPNRHGVLPEQMESNLTFISTSIGTPFSVTSMEVTTCTTEEGVMVGAITMGAAMVGVMMRVGVVTTVGAAMTVVATKVTTCAAKVSASKVTMDSDS